ncbi:hypothetical protein [Microcoleus sp. B4-D4]|uniref:hypothetical protein n=1 Tax=Microcoleus sp. B4-D4 TaxID=2818667 RepID=UPI002FD68167
MIRFKVTACSGAIVSFIGCRAMGIELGKFALLLSVKEEGKGFANSSIITD